MTNSKIVDEIRKDQCSLLVRLSSWGLVLQPERSPVQLLLRTHARDVHSVPSQGTHRRQPTDVSLSHQSFSPSLPHSLYNNFFNSN